MPCALAYQHRYHIGGDQSQQAIGFRRAAIDYISHHEGRLPVVVAARLGRIVEVFRPGQNLSLREFLDHVGKSIARAALFSFYALALLSLGGAMILRRRRMSLFPLLAPIAVVLVTVAITYATPRFRTSAEVVLTVLAAVALDALVERVSVKGASRGARPASACGRRAGR